jgi:hypothetical protein
LASALEALREELESAWLAGLDRRIRFRVTEVTLTLETVARLDRDGSGKIHWWLVEAGAAVRSGRERTQTLTLTLMPLSQDDEGRLEPTLVHGQQPVPDE